MQASSLSRTCSLVLMFYLLEYFRSTEKSSDHNEALTRHDHVLWHQQQTEKKRFKRNASLFLKPVDPLFKSQWHINGGGKDGSDMNVINAWRLGYTGHGVVVTILDDGIQLNHPDLAANYDPQASKDINDNDPDPTPQDNGDNKHGTRCAGEVAAVANNKYCGAGIAHNASIGGVRMLDGLVNDAVEARSLSLNPSHIDIYSASWGPEDDGKTVDGPGPLARQAFVKGIKEGRGGKGSIFVWASGNGGHHTDNCNCDGYTNSIYTLSISSATQAGTKPWYLEECSSTLASTYSSGTPGQHASITTTDQDAKLRPDKICTASHTGTSASAPIAAGVCALALEANPGLTWRDLQHLVVLTSNPRPLLAESGWSHNSLGRMVSHKFGYGLLDAEGLVRRAANWSNVPSQRVCESRVETVDRVLGTKVGSLVTVSMVTDGCDNSPDSVRYLEHVQAKLSLRYAPRGDIKISLTSPRGTQSFLLLPRPKDRVASSFDNWPFLSVHFWGEDPTGEWKLEIINDGSQPASGPGVLKHWQLVMYGTLTNPLETLDTPSVSTRDTTSQQSVSDQCSSGQYRYGDQCVGQCPGGTFVLGLDKQQTCLPCHSSCQQCYGPESYHCLTCHPGQHYYPDQSQCVDTCPPATTDHDGACVHCPKHCELCRSPEQCTACDETTVLSGGECVARCGPQSYHDIALGHCEPCHPTCHTCTGSADTQCGTCKPDLIYFERRCVPHCPETGYTRSRDGKECITCPTGCDACTGHVGQCGNCSQGWIMTSDGQCLQSDSSHCQPGLYHSSGTCLACHRQCKTCSGPRDTDCTSCYPDHRQYLSTCVQTCPHGTYVASHSNLCIPCPHSCSKCDAGKCYECQQHYYLQDGDCVSQCPPGQFPNPASGQCEHCSGQCYECSGPRSDQCVSCHGMGYLVSGRCSMSCPSTTHPHSAFHQCRPCHRSCDSCQAGGGTHCTACSDPRTPLAHGRCVACPPGYYADNGTCSHCHVSCYTCSGPDNDQCSSCPANMVLDQRSRQCKSSSLDWHHLPPLLIIILWLLGGGLVTMISYLLCGLLHAANNSNSKVSYTRVKELSGEDSNVFMDDTDEDTEDEENKFLIIDKL